MSELAEILAVAPDHAFVAGGTVASAWALRKVVGPTLDAIGNALGEFSEYRVRNLLGIGEKIRIRLDKEHDALESTIHPRVAKVLLEEGTWLDDQVAQEYFAGMLIGAAQSGGIENDSLYFAKLAASLAPEHLRFHHAAYEAFRFGPDGLKLADNRQWKKFEIYVPSGPENRVVTNTRQGSVVRALQREGLIGDFGSGGRMDYYREWVPEDAYGFLVGPTAVGAELFLAAYGRQSGFQSLPNMADLPPTATPMPTFERFLLQQTFDVRDGSVGTGWIETPRPAKRD